MFVCGGFAVDDGPRLPEVLRLPHDNPGQGYRVHLGLREVLDPGGGGYQLELWV